jgi:exopolysaccharide production protein ExoZ
MLVNIQALRGLAACLVIFVHLDVFLGALGFITFGSCGVDIFFVISGFIMVYTTQSRHVGPINFFINRLVRIAPTYWLLTLAVFALAVTVPHLLGATRAEPSELLKSLLFIPFQKSNGRFEPILFLGWTLNYEMFFYVLFALGLLFKKCSSIVTILILLTLSLVGLGLKPNETISHFYTDPFLLEFGLGMLIARGMPLLPAQASRSARLFVFVVAIAAVLTLVWEPLLDAGPRLLVFGVPSAVLVASAVTLERWGWKVTSSPMLLLGDASYSIYLTHPFVTQPLQRLAPHLPQRNLITVLLLVLTPLVVAGCGIAFFKFVERPLTVNLRRWLLLANKPVESAHPAVIVNRL